MLTQCSSTSTAPLIPSEPRDWIELVDEREYQKVYSRVHISWNEVFFYEILKKTIPIAEINEMAGVKLS